MKLRPIFVTAFFLAILLHAAVAQPVRETVDVEPPALEKILGNTTSQPNEAVAEVVAITPEIPLGPLDVLKAYEQDMTLVAQKMSAEVASISQAQEANQITREQAEYLIQEKYEVAMMQFQILSALHDALGHDVAQSAAHAKRLRSESDTAVVVQLPSSELSGACK
jgi:phage I-like protein